MSFGTVLALAVGLLIAVPVLAHLLRRGKTQELDFPPAHLVPAIVVTSEQRRRLEDRVLLSLRALMVLALAVLGATPFVRCSRLSVDRQSGASVAMAIVLDDSQSMRATSDEGQRFALAKTGAEQLLDSMREGDAVAIVLAGRPARLALSSTTDLTAARKALTSAEVTDRSTDLGEAVQLARTALKELPHVDKRVVVLSDLATDELPDGEPPLWTPLEALANNAPNCGIASAEQQGPLVLVNVACNDAGAARGRQVELIEAGAADPSPLIAEDLNAAVGEQRLQLRHSAEGFELAVRLSGDDRIVEDDRARVAKEALEMSIGVVADTSRASVITGGPTIIEQALSAVAPGVKVKPLTGVPEHVEDLSTLAAIVVDDPPGLSPGSRQALTAWLERGGVALGLLGPAAASAELAASLEPFARQGAVWEQQAESIAVVPQSLGWLGPEAASLVQLNNAGRVRLDAADLPDTKVVGRWADGVPLLFQREVSNGLVLTLGLPASVDTSDLTLRPGFLALLDYLREQADKRTGPRQSLAGSAWTFPATSNVSITTPGDELLSESPTPETDQDRFVPELAGRYELRREGKTEWRLVVLDPEELIRTPLDLATTQIAAASGGGNDQLDASPEFALFVLLLFAGELFIRAFGGRLRARFRRA